MLPQLSIPQSFDENMARDYLANKSLQKITKRVLAPVTDGIFFLENHLPDIVKVDGSVIEYVNAFDEFLSVFNYLIYYPLILLVRSS